MLAGRDVRHHQRRRADKPSVQKHCRTGRARLDGHRAGRAADVVGTVIECARCADVTVTWRSSVTYPSRMTRTLWAPRESLPTVRGVRPYSRPSTNTRAPGGVERTSRLPTIGAAGAGFGAGFAAGGASATVLSVNSRAGPVVAAASVVDTTDASDGAVSPGLGERPHVPTPKPAANPNAAPIRRAKASGEIADRDRSSPSTLSGDGRYDSISSGGRTGGIPASTMTGAPSRSANRLASGSRRLRLGGCDSSSGGSSGNRGSVSIG